MRKKTKTRIISALLAATMFLTGGLLKGKQNDTQEPEEEPIKVEEVVDEDNITEVYNFGYITYDTPLYDINMNEIGLIDKYQKVYVYKVKDDIAMVHYFGEDNMQIGYVYADIIELLPETFVEVDISDQLVRLYKDSKMILATKTVTGKPASPTNEGYFGLTYKEKDTYLVGPGYRSHVDYWMPFDGGIGLHDADWRSKFGEEIYLTKGSHGCVNLPKKAARTIYETVNTGSKVLVHR